MRRWHLWILSLAIVGVVSPAAQADEAAVRKFVATYVEAFNRQDLPAVAAMWAADGSHADRETGEHTSGREAIQADIAAAFKDLPGAKLSGHIDRIRFLKPDVVKIDGQTSMSTPGEEPSLASFSAILIQENGAWLIASMEETSVPRPATSYDALRELEWLVGKWSDQSEDGLRVETTFRWTTDHAFLLRSFVATSGDDVVRQGTQVIGWDPRSQQIRSWSFNSDGSFGDGSWSRNQDEWLIKSSQTLADGRAASGTYVLSKQDDNTMTLRLIGHEIEGEPQPSHPSVKVVREVEAK